MSKDSYKIFISHASVDVGIAEYIEAIIKKNMPAVNVFRTTRIGQIPSGTDWFSRILSELKTSDRYLILLTPWAMSRPWISFETGAAWMSGRPCVAVVAGGMSKSDVVEPLKYLQLLSIENKDEAETAFDQLGITLPNAEEFVGKVQALSIESRKRSLSEQDWEKVDIDENIYAWDGPLEKLSNGDYKPIERDKFEAVRNAGLELQCCNPDKPEEALSNGYSYLYLIDFNRERKHKLLSNKQVLMVKRKLETES